MINDHRMRAQFVNSLTGLLWREGAQGPHEFDCWGLQRHVQRELFGRELPAAGITPAQVNDLRTVVRAIESHPARAEWTEVAAPADGDLVTMAHHQYPSHIGGFLALDRGGILHTTKETGVSFDAFPALRLKGFARMKFYRFAGAVHAG